MFSAREREVIKYGALQEYGKRRSGAIVGMMFFWRALPSIGVAILIGAAGLGAYHLWTGVRDNLPEADAPSQVITAAPMVLWLAIVAGVIGLLWILSPHRPIRPGTRVMRVAIVVIVTAALAGFWLGVR